MMNANFNKILFDALEKARIQEEEKERKRNINWQYCRNLEEVYDAIKYQDDDDWPGLKSADQIISITFDTDKECYVVFWKDDSHADG